MSERVVIAAICSAATLVALLMLALVIEMFSCHMTECGLGLKPDFATDSSPRCICVRDAE